MPKCYLIVGDRGEYEVGKIEGEEWILDKHGRKIPDEFDPDKHNDDPTKNFYNLEKYHEKYPLLGHRKYQKRPKDIDYKKSY